MTIALANPMLRKLTNLTGLNADEITSRRRYKPIVRARKALMLVLRERTSWSLPQIAHFLNLADHSTVCHGIATAEALCETDPAFAEIVESLRGVESSDPFEGGGKPVTVRSRVKRLPKYTGPIRDRYHYVCQSHDGRAFRLDRHGNTEHETIALNDMRHGSRLLLEAILAERGVAA